MEKLVIIEGTDRTGKDTLVNYLCSTVSNAIKRHWGFPSGSTNEEQTFRQKIAFNREFRIRQIVEREMRNTLMIWNRSHIGEFVYGTIYRDSKPEEWVWNVEKHWKLHEDPEVYLVMLYADPEFLAKEDDGKSYSHKIEDKAKEVRIFLRAFEESGIQNKLLIKVNNGDEYIEQKDIFNQVESFINGERVSETKESQ